MKSIAVLVLAALFPLTFFCAKEIKVGPEEARVIAQEAYIYGTPIVESYKVVYAYAVYKDSGVYKAPFNHLAIVMPDTTQPDSIPQGGIITPPFALSWMDLRKDAAVISVPKMAEGGYHIQLVDLYTHHFEEISTATAGNDGGNYMIVPGPWTGNTPAGITKVIPCETLLALAIIRPVEPLAYADAEKFLNGFDAQSLSEFEGKPAKKSDAMIFPPYSKETALTAGFFQYLNFALQFCPVHPSEIQERARFAKLGIAAGKSFNVATGDRAILDAVNAGITDAQAKLAATVASTPEDSVRYGSRADLKNDFLARAVAAKVRLYGPPASP